MESIYVHSYISKKLPGNFGIQLKAEVSCEGNFIMSRAQWCREGWDSCVSSSPIDTDISHNI